MRVVLFVHSIVSDWNHGNAHFLRGVVTELRGRGHDVRVFEPWDGWSLTNLLRDHGRDAVDDFHAAFPDLQPSFYDLDDFDFDAATDGADLVLVHEWNDPELVSRLGALRAGAAPFRLLFHDTHHRAATAPEEMAAFDLRHYDGVLAFGSVIRDLYLERGWTRRAWTWHEAADVRLFHPERPAPQPEGDVVWIGNWGDGERTNELREFLLDPVARLGLRGSMYGVRYPKEAVAAVTAAGLDHRGWIPNHRVPAAFARHRATVHVPRRPYVEALPGIPTIRVFEALACGIPLISAPWEDREGLFEPGRDFLVARNGDEMTEHLRAVVSDPALARSLGDHGLRTIRERHTCAHRVDELLHIADDLGVDVRPTERTAAEATR